jgi:DNA-binding MarR family transcriptional regulator
LNPSSRHMVSSAEMFLEGRDETTLARVLEPGLSNATLARAAFVTPQSMQGVIANLECVGLIVRSADPSHGRILRTELTPRGRRVLAKAHEVAAHIEALMVAAVGNKEAEHLAALLTRCADRLTQDATAE